MADSKRSQFRGLFDSFAELNRMREHWQQIEPSPEARTQASAWVPTLDIYAQEDDLVIRCELAGVGKDDVEVSLSGNSLWISGERTDDPQERENVSVYVRERRYGTFRRNITLPETIDSDMIRATFVDGLLEITIDGGVDPRDHKRIEIGGKDNAEVELDVGRADR
jgi:HSP20 family protein